MAKTLATKKIHEHKWSKPYLGTMRVCENGRCGAIRYANGNIVILSVRKKRAKRG